MQTLGLTDDARSESRLKTLFWPTIQSGADVDYLGAQGFWVCTLIGAITFIMLLATGSPLMAASMLLFFHFGGVGVRERDLFAATIVLGYYALDLVMSLMFMRVGGPGAIVVRPLIAALLLSNLRATWIASKWEPTSENAALPPRFAETLSDKFADQWPAWIWPKVRIVYYILSLLLLLLAVVGVASLLLRPFAKSDPEKSVVTMAAAEPSDGAIRPLAAIGVRTCSRGPGL